MKGKYKRLWDLECQILRTLDTVKVLAFENIFLKTNLKKKKYYENFEHPNVCLMFGTTAAALSVFTETHVQCGLNDLWDKSLISTNTG